MLTKAGAKLLDFGLAKRELPAVVGSGLSMAPTWLELARKAPFSAPSTRRTARREGRRGYRHLRHGAVRDGHGEEGVRGQEPGGPHRRHPRTRPCSGVDDPAHLPAALDRVVQRCLAKDPDERWQSAGDLAAQLKWIDEKGASRIPARVSASRTWIAVAVVMTLVATALGVAAIYFSRATGVERVFQFSVLPPEKSIFDSGQPGFAPIVSPDGTRLAFTARDASGTIQIWVRPLDTLTPRLLQGTEGASYPFWSPDSRSIAFIAQEALRESTLPVARS